MRSGSKVTEASYSATILGMEYLTLSDLSIYLETSPDPRRRNMGGLLPTPRPLLAIH
jgi:hypothetical protein